MPQACRTISEAAKRGSRSRAKPAHVRLNRMITAAGECSQQTVLDLVQSCCQEMSLVNASTAWHCIARLDTEDKRTWEPDSSIVMLQRQTKYLLSEFLAAEKDEDPHHRCVATITWACAKLKLHDADMMSALGDLAVRWLWSFKPFELGNVLWGFAKLQVKHATLFQHAHSCILRSLQRFPTRSLSMTAWAFATIRFGACQGLLSQMAAVFVRGLAAGDDANPVTIANMVWALATTGANVPRAALQAMAAMAAAELESFRAHELSVMLWACARLDACHEGLFARAMGLLRGNQRLREEIHSQGIANLLWAFARYSKGVHDSGGPMMQDMLAALLPTLVRLLPKLNSMEISSSVWAISQLVPRWGQHPTVDSILVEAAKDLLAKPQLLAGMSSHGASGLLSAYSEFFRGSPCAPKPCQELVARLGELCASFVQEAHVAQVRAEAASAPYAHKTADGGGLRRVWAHVAHKLTDGDAVVEPVCGAQGPASPPPGGWVPQGWPSARSAAGAPQTQAIGLRQMAAREPAYVDPFYGTPKARAQPQGRGHPQRETPSAMETQPSRLVSSCSPELSSKLPAPQAPAIAIVEEFTSRSKDLQENQIVDIAVKVNDSNMNEVICIVVEVFANFGKQHSFVIPAADIDACGMYKLRLPQYDGRWSVYFTLVSICGEVIGTPASVSFLSKPAAARLKSQDYLSATSSCFDTDAGRTTCTGSAYSDFSDSDQDEEAEVPIVCQRAM